LPDSAEVLVRRGGKINHHFIAHVLVTFLPKVIEIMYVEITASQVCSKGLHREWEFGIPVLHMGITLEWETTKYISGMGTAGNGNRDMEM